VLLVLVNFTQPRKAYLAKHDGIAILITSMKIQQIQPNELKQQYPAQK
jgi:hypothetical protein